MLSSALSASVKAVTCHFLHSVNGVYYIDFPTFNHIDFPMLHSRCGSYLVTACESFNVLFNSVWCYFVKDFCVNVHQGYWSVGHFVVSLSDLGIRVMLASG